MANPGGIIPPIDGVVEKAIEDHYKKIKSSLIRNNLFSTFKCLARECGFSIAFALTKSEEKNRIYFFLSINCLDENNRVFLIPSESVFYDEIGSLGASECVLQYDKIKKILKKYKPSSELFDDIEKSIEFLTFFKSTLEEH